MFAFRRIPFDDLFSVPSVFIDDQDDDSFFGYPFAIMDDELENKRNKRFAECQNNNACLCRRSDKKNSLKRRGFFDALQKLDSDSFGRMNLKENDNGYEMSLDLPGMKKEDLKLSFENDNLVIEGERKEEKEEKNEKVHLRECHFGSFYRSIPLPKNVDTEKVSASYVDGVLKILLEKKENESDKKYICVN